MIRIIDGNKRNGKVVQKVTDQRGNLRHYNVVPRNKIGDSRHVQTFPTLWEARKAAELRAS